MRRMTINKQSTNNGLTCVKFAESYRNDQKWAKDFSCEHHKIFKVYLAIFQHYLWKG